MNRIARLATARPRLVFGLWSGLAVLSLIAGRNAIQELHQTDLSVGGSGEARYQQLINREFGYRIAMAILIKGPPTAVEQAGPRLVKRLEGIEGVQVLSPWASGGGKTIRTLREPPGEAMLALQVNKSERTVTDDIEPQVRRVLSSRAGPRVDTDLVGLAPYWRAANESALQASKTGELIALPILFALLLIIFRSPVAALVPALAGLLVTRIGTAVMVGISDFAPIDGFGINALTVIGLALGVDYSLLVVSRYREELAAGSSVEVAVQETVVRAGRTVVCAGTILVLAMGSAMWVLGGGVLTSMGLGSVVAAILAMIAALFAMPSVLMLIGQNIDRWSIGGSGAGGWQRVSRRALKAPGLAVLLIAIPLMLLAIPAFSASTGAASLTNLPHGNATRQQFDDFSDKRGPGWLGPYEIAFRSAAPVTDSKKLAAISRFEKRAARIPGVAAVIGPSPLARSAETIRALTNRSLNGNDQLSRLAVALQRSIRGVGTLRDGISAAADGSSALATGLGRASSGSSRLAGDVQQAAPGARDLANGVKRTNSGASELSSGVSQAEKASKELAAALGQFKQGAEEQAKGADSQFKQPLTEIGAKAQAALQALAGAPPSVASDSSVQAAEQQLQSQLSSIQQFGQELANSSNQTQANIATIDKIADGAAKLSTELSRIATGSDKLSTGISRTSSGSAQLAEGVALLGNGTDDLSAGLARLSGDANGGGATTLASGLRSAELGTDQLGRGLQALEDRVVTIRTSTGSDTQQLESSGGNLRRAIRSGYMTMAGIEGSQPQTRTNASFIVNASHGGTVIRTMVIGEKDPFDVGPASIALSNRLTQEADRTANQIDGRAFVGGMPQRMQTFEQRMSARLPWMVVVLALVTLIALMIFFRSPVLAFCAVVLNLLTLGAAVGLLVLLFQGSGRLSVIALGTVIAVVFALSIDYEVFLISRLIEGRRLTGTTTGAIEHCLTHTARIVTGAAFIMVGVFLTFAIPDISTLRQLGIGLSVAVAIDATLVRLVLLPALVVIFGERTWWVPRVLDRHLGRPLA